MITDASSSQAPRVFPNTRWSVVLAARLPTPESAAAPEIICRDYWYALYACVRRCGHSAHDAQDLRRNFSDACWKNAGWVGCPFTAYQSL